ncbi:uncharacterized protein [Montipora capricornis]|uniref:uncharacterized protein n=1 Tax=Montipora capricornis TaxID=246305 RepID=UPI0035F15848
MIFGAASSSCMANYVLRKTALDNRQDVAFSADRIKSVEKNFYKDDFLKSVCDETTAVRMFREMTSLLARGGFRFTKWISSSREVLSQIPPQEKASPSVDLNFDKLPIERTLGLKWNTETDCFRFSVYSHQTSESTKRGVLSRLSTVFDPLGVLAPYMLPAKCLVQSLRHKNKDWDEPLDEGDQDAIFWSDSKTVLQYIANESRRFHTFVANRVSEIHDTTDQTQWRHVPGHCNPADDCTRGLRAPDLDHHCRWLNGPAFLSKSEEHWPQNTLFGPLRENDDEVKNTKWSGHTSVSETRAYFPNPEKFSSWTRFRCVLGWICRFVENCKRKAEHRVLSSLTATKIHNAEMIAVRKSQRDSFHLDIEALRANKRLPVRSRLSALTPTSMKHNA